MTINFWRVGSGQCVPFSPEHERTPEFLSMENNKEIEEKRPPRFSTFSWTINTFRFMEKQTHTQSPLQTSMIFSWQINFTRKNATFLARSLKSTPSLIFLIPQQSWTGKRDCKDQKILRVCFLHFFFFFCCGVDSARRVTHAKCKNPKQNTDFLRS